MRIAIYRGPILNDAQREPFHKPVFRALGPLLEKVALAVLRDAWSWSRKSRTIVRGRYRLPEDR
jgi:hypothetical protein